MDSPRCADEIEQAGVLATRPACAESQARTEVPTQVSSVGETGAYDISAVVIADVGAYRDRKFIRSTDGCPQPRPLRVRG